MKVKKILESNYFIIVNLFIGFFFWAIGLQSIGIILLSIIIGCIFLFCDNIKNIFCVLFFLPSFIDNFEKEPDWLSYGIAITIGVVFSTYYVIKKIIKNNKEITKGKLFYGFVFSTVAFLLGGVIGRFNFKYFLIILAFSILSYYIYWLAINFTKDLKTNLCYTFIFGSLFLIAQYCFIACKSKDFINFITNRIVVNLASQNINVVSLYIFIGAIMCFFAGYKTKKDYLFVLLSILLCMSNLFTRCRIVILMTFVSELPCVIFTIIASKNKLKILWSFLFVFFFIGIFFKLNQEFFIHIISSILNKNMLGLNGRESLWKWCWNLFTQNPIFGYGFISDQPVPGVHDYIYLISAHCTPLQWLASLGLVGTCLMSIWYTCKCKIIFNKNTNWFFCLIIIMIEFFGLFQAVSLDFFIYIVTILLLSSCETIKK